METTFMRALHSRTLFFEAPHAAVYLLVTLNIAAYLLCLHYSGAMVIPTEILFRNGAMYSSAIGRQEYWRLVAFGFLHASLFHLATNMLCLVLWGGLLEKRIGSVYFIVVYVCALVAGGIVSDLTHSREYFTVGASGAVSGILGALLCLWILAKIDLSASFFVFNIGLNVALTLSSSQIDWGVHFGGFAAGFISCAVLDILERAHVYVLRCKFPEFAKMNCLLVAGALAIECFESTPVVFPLRDGIWPRLFTYSILCLGFVKLLDLLLSIKKGLAATVIVFSVANAALAFVIARGLAPALISICAVPRSKGEDLLETLRGLACQNMDMTIYIMAGSVFASTILVYWRQLHRGIMDVGFVAASLRAERQRRHGI
jgi:membrane associated rhomboid family serine protease